MALSNINIILLLLACSVGFVHAEFKIVEPYPKNVYIFKYDSTQVTCVAYDDNDTSPAIPEKILFIRKDKYAVYTTLTANDNIYFMNRTEENGRKLFVTLHIKNVTNEDDSQFGRLGRYECHAYAVNDSKVRKYGFSINVLERNEVPQVVTSKVGILQHGDTVSLKCNVTDTGSLATKLKSIAWFKDGVMVKHKTDAKDTIDSLAIINAGPKHGGNYTCLLEIIVRSAKTLNITDTTEVQIAPWLEKEKGETMTKRIGENVKMECSARGFPLTVEWKVIYSKSETVFRCSDLLMNKRYKVERKGIYDPYTLSITNVNRKDTGNYYCCLPSNCSADVQNSCQRFSLTVKDLPRSSDSPPTKTTTSSEKREEEGASMVLSSSRGVILVTMAFVVLFYYFGAHA